MTRRLVARAALATGTLLAVIGCGGATTTTSSSVALPTPTPTSAPTPTATPTPTPSPTPAPDDEAITVVETGVGAYLETTFPVAVLHSQATGHTARQVVIHLVVSAGGRQLGAVDARVDAIAPGATVPVATRLQARATPGETASASVTSGTWEEGGGPGAVATIGPATFSCPRCGASASGDVQASLTPAPALAAGTPLQLTAVCRSAAGAIVGGGGQLFVPPAGASAGVQVDVPTIVSAKPANCAVSAQTGGF